MAAGSTARSDRLRLVEEGWSCKRSGDCCRTIPEVVMTVQERDALEAFLKAEGRAAEVARLRWQAGPRQTSGVEFATLMPFAEGVGCPFLSTEGRSATPYCTVHAVRPYNCRRFGCLRPDPKTEPYEPEEFDPASGKYGSRNLSDRLRTSRVARRLFALIQRKAQRWALSHGWRND